MENCTLEKAIVLAELTLKSMKPAFHQNGTSVVLDGVANEKDALRIINTLDDDGSVMTLQRSTITGLYDRDSNNPGIALPDQATDVAYDPKKQELYIDARAVRKLAVQVYCDRGERGVSPTLLRPYIELTSGVGALQELKQAFEKIADVMPPNTNWHDVRASSVSSSVLATSVKAVDQIIAKSGLAEELQRMQNNDPAKAVLSSTGLAYLDRARF